MTRGAGWPIAIVSILGITVIANFAVLYVADHDPSFAIEKDYYQKAVHYDDEMEQELRNQQLGWRLTPTVTPIARSGAEMVVRLTDAKGAPLAGVQLSVSAFHSARAMDVLDARFTAQGDSGYVVRLPMHRAGEWELHFDAIRGHDHFTAIRRVDVPAGRT